MAFYDHAYANFNFKLSSYANQLDSSSKQVYLEKLIIHKPDGSFFSLPDPFILKEEDWVDDISLWPRIKKSHIVKYLESSPGKNHRSLSAFEYVTSGKVQNVKIYIPLELPNLKILSASVQPSQRCNADLHKAWVIAEDKGSIRTAHCTCTAGFGEVCSHVSALLYKVQFAVGVGLTSAPTEERCKWNNSFRKEIKACRIEDIDFQKSTWGGNAKKRRRMSVLPQKNVTPVTKEQIEELRKISPNSVLFTVLLDSEDTDTASENDDHGHDENVELPKSISEVINKHEITGNHSLLPYFTETQIKLVEVKTRSQRNSLWFTQRCGRLTSSNFGEILKKKKVSHSFIEKFTNLQKEINVPSVKWGKEKEIKAFEAYFDAERKKHTNFSVEKAGLFISTSDPYLGCSPDGVVECDCCGKGVLEIKCPYKYRNVDPRTIAANDNKFYMNLDGSLKEEHNYYAQVQGQMAITNTDYCDFVIWTTVDLIIHRVRRDNHFWEVNKPTLQQFYFNHVMPALKKK